MEEKKVLYSKRFSKEYLLDLEEKVEQLNSENKFDDGLEEGESFLDFIQKNQEYVPNEERLAEKDLFIKAAIDLADSYEIDTDIIEYDTRVIANIYLQTALYSGTLKKILSALIVMADQFDVFPPNEGEHYTVNLLLTYHTHDIYLKGRKITDLDWDD